ncbi:transcription initiation factor TFIID [Aspergillus sp. HF37]|nr:transcription initiation factor TFIID [Aspergillus sp. HF37]
MPHAEEPPPAAQAEDADYESFLARLAGGFEQGTTSFDFMNRELEVGDKADDAVDYEDFDFESDDLPEEDRIPHADRPSSLPAIPPTEPPTAPPAAPGEEPTIPEDPDKGLFEAEEDGLFQTTEGDDQKFQADELDDLFGEGLPSPGPGQVDPTRDLFEDENLPPMPETVETPAAEPERELIPEPEPNFETEPLGAIEDEPMRDAPVSAAEQGMDPATLRAWKLQMELFAISAQGPENPPAPPENVDDLLHSLFPSFNRKDLPRFLELIPPKKAYFVGKQPIKPPKPVLPTKVNLELAHDQERLFKAGGQAPKRSLDPDQLGLVSIESPEEEEDIKEDFEQETDNEVLPGGVTLQDLRVICSDWDVKDASSVMDIIEEPPVKDTHDAADEDDWLFETTRPAKKRKIGRDPKDIVALSHVDVPIADDIEHATSRLARKVTVDMNDPHLLLDERVPDPGIQKARALGAVGKDEVDAGMTRRLNQRYNISNDQAYDMLKQNHQHKIRSTLGNFTLEHAMPAVRLQWPYYKTELAKAEARSFHRPALTFRPGQTCWFKNPAFVKRKHQRGKDARSVFDSTKSLSLADNSNALLVEYSEEVPLMLSNFGMSNRFINYYRRKNMDDATRPKADLGETVVLLPQDKSPFSIFGHVDPGDISQAISNSMYRAPIYPHQAKSNDFLVVRSTTGSGGSDYYLRNIENLYVAGQQFPSVDVPGPNSRKVTTVAKNRMKMLVYRLLKRTPDLRLSISDVTAHLPGTTDMQNRQKVKDFLQHDKDSKYWVPSDPIPESDTIRSWVHPEDVCLLESMQVGQQHLHDTGYGNDAETGGDEDVDEEGDSFEQQMAPWKASRSFLLASQGKAMLKLHGEGDPTGRGEGYSFIKTSMKGGFKAVGESVEDKLDAQRLKELGGHSYNVARQQRSYETSIRRIWEAQKASLSSTLEHSEYDSDMDRDEDVEEEFNKPTPRSEATPAFGRRDDETTSQFSKMSMHSQKGKVLRIVRNVRDANTGQIVQKEQIVWDPRVIRHYMQHRYRVQAVSTKLDTLAPTGNKDVDERNKKLLENELSRLNRNKERRFAREKQKGHVRASTGESPAEGGAGTGGGGGGGGGKPAGTQRKCANCGQVGHIKTNKKLCPMLNGTMKPEDRMGDSAFSMGAPPAI